VIAIILSDKVRRTILAILLFAAFMINGLGLAPQFEAFHTVSSASGDKVISSTQQD
jgi:hypothetical protein